MEAATVVRQNRINYRQGAMIVVSLLLVAFIGSTFPWSHSPRPSQLTVRLLPVAEWGFGYYCAESPTRPSSGYYYGVIRVARRYDFRSNKEHQDKQQSLRLY